MTTPTVITITGNVLPLGDVTKLTFRIPTVLYSTSTPDVIMPNDTVVVPDGSGNFSVALYGTNDPAWSPSNWTYTMRAEGPDVTIEYSISIPYDLASPANFSFILPALPASSGTLYAAYNHTHAGGGGGSGPTAATSVTDETAFGVTKSVGVAASYARGDHTHGSPSLGTTSTTAAAGNHNHDTAYDASGAASTAVANHVAVSNPHSQYQLTSTLNETVQDMIASFLVAGTNVTLTYNDAGNSLTIAAAGGGGGSGITPTFARTNVTSGSVTMVNDASWTVVAGLTLSIAAVVGDNVTAFLGALLDHNASSTDFYELVVIASGGGIARFGSTNTSSPTPIGEGDPSMYPANNKFTGSATQMSFTVAAGDLTTGNVVFGIAHKGPGGGKVYAESNYPLRLFARNDKQ